MKDERISSLLDSNNELSLELTQKNQTILPMENEIVLSKSDTGNDKDPNDLIKSVIKKINGQKKSYESTFKGKEYLTISCQDDIDYIESINPPPETGITTTKDLKEFSEISAKLKSILAKFHTERDKYRKENTGNYISVPIRPTTQTLSIAESETVETTTTYESDNELSIQCNDLSTQTDFAPTMSLESFDELNTIRLDCPAPARLTIFEQEKNLKNQAINESLEKRKRWFQQFQLLAKNRKDLIFIKFEAQTPEVISRPNSADKSEHPGEIDVRKRATVLLPSFFRESSSQTEISTLLIGLDFQDHLPTDDYQFKIRKLNGQLLTMNDDLLKLNAETNRFRQYCDDLSAGKEITVSKSDLSDEVLDGVSLEKIVKLIPQMNEKKLQIVQHIKVFKEKYPSVVVRFEEDIDYVESNIISISSDIPAVETYEQMHMMSIELNSIEQKFANFIKSYALRTITLSQLQNMITKISNQKGTILGAYSKLENEFKADFDYAESIELPKITDPMHLEAIERSYENAKLINMRLKMILSKFNGLPVTGNKNIKLVSAKSESSSDVTDSSIGFKSERSSLLQDEQMPVEDSVSKTSNDLSTQTDFTPAITRSTFNKYDIVRRHYPDPQSHLSELERLFETIKQNNQISLSINQKKTESQLEDFQKKALQKKDKINFEVAEFSNFYWLIKGYRKTGFFPNRTEIMTAVKSQFSDSSDGFTLQF